MGRVEMNKGYVQYTGERGGDIFLEIFSNPRGGAERLSHVSPVFDKLLQNGTILLSDGVKGVKAYILDHPQKNLLHLWINHSKKGDTGFTWHCYLDHEDGFGFESLVDGEFRVVEVSTQDADGCAARVKKFLRSFSNHRQEFFKAYIKEYQFRQNNSNSDIFIQFLTEWGKVETLLRAREIKISDLESLVSWDFSSYIEFDPFNFIPEWECPGCVWKIVGEGWSKERTKHKRDCRYYEKHGPPRSYSHDTARCMCCIIPYHTSSSSSKKQALSVLYGERQPRTSKKIGKKKVPLYTCPTCQRRICDTPASRWQHRQRNPVCRKNYEKMKKAKI